MYVRCGDGKYCWLLITRHSLVRGKGEVFVFYPPFAERIGEVFILLYVFFVTRHSLVRAKSEVFVLLYVFFVCFFVPSTISRQPAGRFTPQFACGRTLVPDVSSPLLGVGGPRRAEKGANEIFVTMGVNGEFLHFGGF